LALPNLAATLHQHGRIDLSQPATAVGNANAEPEEEAAFMRGVVVGSIRRSDAAFDEASCAAPSPPSIPKEPSAPEPGLARGAPPKPTVGVRVRRLARRLKRALTGPRNKKIKRALTRPRNKKTKRAKRPPKPESLGAVVRRARQAVSAGDLEGALAIYRAAPPEIQEHARIKAKRAKVVRHLRWREQQRVAAFVRQMHQLRRSGDIAAALATHEAAPRELRESLEVLHEYARLLLQSRRFSDAYDVYRALLASNPSDGNAWVGAGFALVRLGLRQELAALIDEMLTALPASAEVLLQASSLARSGDLHALAGRLCDRILSSATRPDPAATVEAARTLLGHGEEGRVIRLLDRADIRSDLELGSQALALQDLALARLRSAGRDLEAGPIEATERADVIAVEAMLQHAGEARARCRPVQDAIAIVLGSLGPGGIQRQIVQLVSRIRKAGHGPVGPIVLLLVNQSKLEPEFHKGALAGLDITIDQIADSKVRPVDVVPADIAARMGVLPDILAARVAFLIDRLRHHRPSVVLAMGDPVGVPVMLAESIVGVPRVVVSARGEPPPVGGARERLFKPAFKAALARNAVVLSANSQATARSLADWLGEPHDRVKTIFNGVDVDGLLSDRDSSATAAHRRSLNIPDEARVVGSVFNYRRAKRPELWIEAAALIARRAPDVVFVTVGGGSTDNDFISMLRKLGLEGRFHRAGMRRDVATWIDLMDVFLLTSASEGTPNALLEAQALGRPVVATGVGGNAETFLAGETGILLSPDPTPEEIADAVMRILNDSGFAARAREHAPRFIRQRFGIDRMVSEFLDICFGADAGTGTSGSPVRASALPPPAVDKGRGAA
jgi:glycosyltransferase involved in cell wall biosynthesis/tetratricopeptide (TPR) repeat protein